MKGGASFLIGIIGLCLFASMALMVPVYMRQSEGLPVFLLLIVAAFVFLNLLIVGFFRVLGHLHETVLYPDDPYSYPQRGRVLFLVGYVGLLLSLVFGLFIALLPELTRHRFNRHEGEILLVLCWFAGWIFFGCLFGGVLAMLGDLYHKAFYRTTLHPPDAAAEDEFDVSHRSSRRSDRDAERRARSWEE